MEPYYIDLYKSYFREGYGYNMSKGGEGNSRKLSEETKRKISEANRGKTKIRRVPLKPKIVKICTRLPNTPALWTQIPEMKQKIGAIISQKNKERGSGIPLRKEYIIYYKNGTQTEVSGLSNFAKENGYNANCLWHIANGNRTSAHKDIIKIIYKNEPEKSIIKEKPLLKSITHKEELSEIYSKIHSRNYKITFEDGHIEIINGIKKFCKDRGYWITCLRKVKTGKSKKHKDIINIEEII